MIINNKKYLIIGFVLSIFLYFPKGSIDINSFHNDDYLLYSALNNLGDSVFDVLQFIFSAAVFKFRPISNLIYYAEYFVFRDSFKLYIIFNIFLLTYILSLVLNILRVKSILSKIAVTLLIVTSRFLTYGIWNITGSFELVSIILMLLIIINILDKGDIRLFVILNLILLFTYERYLIFIVISPLLLIYYKNINFENILTNKKLIFLSIIFVLIYLVTRVIVGGPLVTGTQTHDVIRSFDYLKVITRVAESFINILGIPVGPPHLTGYNFAYMFDRPNIANQFYEFFCEVVAISMFSLLIFLRYNKKNIILLISAFAIIVSSSITFHLEMRWLLSPFILVIIAIFDDEAEIKNGAALVWIKTITLIGLINLLILEKTPFHLSFPIIIVVAMCLFSFNKEIKIRGNFIQALVLIFSLTTNFYYFSSLIGNLYFTQILKNHNLWIGY